MNTLISHSPHPLVCICVPTYNAEHTVRETLESICAQTYSNLVIHVSDNASTDDTLKVVASINDPRIHVHSQKENVGGEGNFTRCIQMAEGKYTAIFHADDVYHPDMVEKQVYFLEANSEVGSVFTQAFTVDEHGKRTGLIGRVPEKDKEGKPIGFEDLLKMMLLHHNFLVCPSVLVRTDIYKHHIKEWGSSLFQSASDIDTWLRLSEIKPIAVLNEALMGYRISSAQFSEKIRNRTEKTDFFLVMDHYLGKDEVRDFLTEKDLQHYGWLDRHESVACAINLLKLGRVSKARALLKNVFCWDALKAAFYTRRGCATLMVGVLLQIFIPMRLALKKLCLIAYFNGSRK